MVVELGNLCIWILAVVIHHHREVSTLTQTLRQSAVPHDLSVEEGETADTLYILDTEFLTIKPQYRVQFASGETIGSE